MATELVTVTINGREARVPKGTLLVEAAKQVGIEIPVFCYHPKLKSVGACRMCLVSVEKMPRLQTACTTPVTDGMVASSSGPEAIAAQNGVVELLLANHPLDCPICDKGGECPLQDNTFKYGLGTSRFTEEKLHKDKAFPLSDRIVLDKERCILCYRCTRFQAEIPGDEAIVAINRGGVSEVGVLEGETFDSVFSGNTIELCPVGALTSRQYRFKARPWDLERTPSVCIGCAVGCNVSVHSRNERVLRLVARENPAVDDGWLCDYGRFDTMPPARERRARFPMVRHGTGLVETTYEQALARAAELLTQPGAGVLLSPRLTNEALFLFQAELRPRLAPEAAVAFWPRTAAPWPLQGQIADLLTCKTIVLVGLDAWQELPILALWIRKAVARGAKLVVVGATNGLYRDTHAWLKTERGAEGPLLEGLLAALAGETATPELATAAALLEGRPTTLLAGPHPAGHAALRVLLERLGEALEAGAGGGLVGCPPLAANGRGALDLARELALADSDEIDARIAAAGTLLLLGHEPWRPLSAQHLVVASSVLPDQSEQVDVVLPVTYPYEQNGSYTNLEGRVQQLNPGGGAPPGARMDWELLADLAARLGASVTPDLYQVRMALSLKHPAYGAALSGGLPPQGRLLGPVPAGAARG